MFLKDRKFLTRLYAVKIFHEVRHYSPRVYKTLKSFTLNKWSFFIFQPIGS